MKRTPLGSLHRTVLVILLSGAGSTMQGVYAEDLTLPPYSASTYAPPLSIEEIEQRSSPGFRITRPGVSGDGEAALDGRDELSERGLAGAAAKPTDLVPLTMHADEPNKVALVPTQARPGTDPSQPPAPPLRAETPPLAAAPGEVPTEGAEPESGTESALDDEGATEINVKNADLEAVIRIFGKKTKRNFILDEKVRGKVSIFLPGRVSAEEAIRILDSVLALKGFAAVPIGENLWKVVPAQEARSSTIPTIRGDESTPSDLGPTAQFVTRLMRLKFVSAEDIKQLITPLVSKEGLVNAYTGTNSLIIIDNHNNIERLVSIIEEVDVPFSDRELTLIPITNAEATDIAAKLEQILGEGREESEGRGEVSSRLDLIRARLRGANPPMAANGANQAGTESSATSATVSARSRAPKIIPDERTNSLIVVADDDMTARIQALVSKLDSPVDLSGRRFYVYRVQHAKAEELADVLAGLIGGTTGSNALGTGRTSPFGSTERRTDRETPRRTSLGTSLGGSTRTTSNRTTAGTSTTSPTAVQLGDDVSVTADPATNSLVIFAGKSEYQKIRALLEKLDIKRRQVLVEAMLLEVGVTDDMNLGTSWLTSTGGSDGGVLAGNNFSNLAQVFSNPTQLSAFSVAAASSGTLSIGDNITVPTQSVLLNAAASNSNVNVLSAPTVLATDNEQAEILVGQNVPFISSVSTSQDNLNNTFNQVDRENVGITLRLTPRISSNNFVTLNLFTEVSSVIPGTIDSNLGPTTTKRASETTVITKNGQMIVIGGLMSDDITDSESGVPFLKDVPVFGHLFRSVTESRRRTNLLIFITPRIVRDQFDARELTVGRRDAMEGVIDQFEVNPRRAEVLRSVDIDRVAETDVVQDDDPESGTQAAFGTFEPIRAPAASRPSSDGAPLELSASPALPPSLRAPRSGATAGTLGESMTVSPKVEQNAAVTPQLFPPASRQGASMTQALTSGQFVVLQLEGEMPSGLRLPFDVNTSGMVGIIVPADSTPRARLFFSAGKRYRYQVDGKDVQFVAQGVYPSPDDARSLHPSLSGWYTMSPYELMALDRGPWLQLR